MPPIFQLNPQLAITHWSDQLGKITAESVSDSLLRAGLRFIRYDDAWRPLAEAATLHEGGASWNDLYGGNRAWGQPAEVGYPHYWPANFDLWPYAGDMKSVQPMEFAAEISSKMVSSPFAEGVEFTIRITDLRTPGEVYPQQVIKMPVGIELPLAAAARVYGTAEMFHECRQLDYALADAALPREWYYLEAELFGGYSANLGEKATLDPGRPTDRLHAGAPFVAASNDGKNWWGIASEADYGAATLFADDRLRHFTTLYLRPGGVAEWSLVLWRQQTDEPQQLLLAATRADGFFNALNPLGFTPTGAPAGPIVFANVSRLPFQMAELKKLQPGLVLLNYHYDHISSTANLYGEWRTYEGFAYSETKLKSLIASLKQIGTKVGFYGTHATQPESHVVVESEDYFLDAWGRRIHDWEPANWVADPGHADAAERYARAEAELAQYYQFDAVFVDRLDFMGINANPARQGRGERLSLIPSLRLGLIELNKERMRWQRKLNPNLAVGLNNTTQWAGVRYSDFCLLEGGDEMRDYALPWLMQPQGVVNKRHFSLIFGDYAGGNLFQVIGGADSTGDFLATLRNFIRRSLVSGVVAQPYGDEIFVDKASMFYQPGHDKAQPDEDKNALLAAINYYGGEEWHQYWQAIAPALAAAKRVATPAARLLTAPDESIDFPHRMLARQGDGGGWYIGLLNESDQLQKVDMQLAGNNIIGDIPPEMVRVWWCDPADGQWHTLLF